MRGQSRADQRANARNRLERLSRSVLSLPSPDLLVDRRHMRVHRPQLIGQNLHNRERTGRDLRELFIIFVEHLDELPDVLDPFPYDHAKFRELAPEGNSQPPCADP